MPKYLNKPLVTVVVPSFNQGQFLDQALSSIFQQKISMEVFVMDGGSTDNSIDIIKKWAPKLAGWRSWPDDGQASAVNEGVKMGSAPFLYWVNSDDWILPGGLRTLLSSLQKQPKAPAVYGRSWNFKQSSGKYTSTFVEAFVEYRLAFRCIISQPATLIRRSAWQKVGGLDHSLHMSMDYDLWWRLYKKIGPLYFVDDFVAVNRDHDACKTRTNRRLHFQESINIVRKYYGDVPLKWWLIYPYSVWWKSMCRLFVRSE